MWQDNAWQAFTTRPVGRIVGKKCNTVKLPFVGKIICFSEFCDYFFVLGW